MCCVCVCVHVCVYVREREREKEREREESMRLHRCASALGLHDLLRPRPALVIFAPRNCYTPLYPYVRMCKLLPLNFPCSEEERKSKYQSMHEDNPLYAEVEEVLKEETVVSVEREVVIETVGQDSDLPDFEFESSKT